MLIVTRYHDFSCAHRAPRDTGKCNNIHGHNYRVHFTVQRVAGAGLVKDGRVLDFSIIKDTLCEWLEKNWDHQLLLWENDPLWEEWTTSLAFPSAWATVLAHSIQAVPFDTSTEMMADYLLNVVGPNLLRGHDCRLIHVRIEETRKCGAEALL